MTKGFTLAQQAEPVLDYCPVRSTDRDCSLLMLRSRAKSAAPITLRFTRFAFTLAEVLITLAIIGVVAAMTIPTLIQNYQEKVTVTKLKKFYSVMSQAYQMAEQDYGDPTNWNLIANNSIEGAENFLNTVAPYLKVQKNCGRQPGCYPDNIAYKTNNGGSDQWPGKAATMILADGSLVSFMVRSENCTYSRGYGELADTCGNIYIDTNGLKPPNAFSRDFFWFYVAKNGSIIPTGTQNDTYYTFDRDCKRPGSSGHGCTAWVLLNENLDYLHCDNLSWDGPTKCH